MPRADAQACLHTGLAALQARQPDAAARAFRQGLRQAPDAAALHANLALALEALGDWAGAEASARAAVRHAPALAEPYVNLGGLLTRQRRLDDALAVYQAALAAGVANAALWSNLGVLRASLGEDDAALACYQQALALEPSHASAQFNQAYVYLRRGDYARGWAALEARDWYAALARQLPWPRWQGEALAGRALLIGLEAGLGDMIQFCRYAAQLKALGARRVGVLCHPPLAALFARLEGVDAVYALGSEIDEDWDVWSPPLSLPHHCHTRLDSIPAALPYLHAEPARMAAWAPRLPPREAGWRVGLVWKGNPKFENDAERSLPSLAALAPLAALPGVQWISLQKGAGQAEARAADAPLPLWPLGEDFADLADTAAVLRQLDLVISVDTAVAHLAGALAVPCWVLLPAYQTDWRWLAGREDSPWYPGCLRLFRQPTRGDWATPIQRVAQALAAWGDGRAPGVNPICTTPPQ